MSEIKGYKATMPDGRPWYNFSAEPYAVGRTYWHKGELMPCLAGLHFCRRLQNVYNSYRETYQTRVFEVTASGRCLENGEKCCTDRLRIDRELSPKEILDILALCIGDDPGAETAFIPLVSSLMSTPYEPSDGDYSGCSDYGFMRCTKQIFEYLIDRRREFLRAARNLASSNQQIREILEEIPVCLEDAIDD